MAKRKKTASKRTSREPNDPATAYARSVVDGKTVAGPHVRAACTRHLRDLREGPKRGLRWDVDEVHRVIGFFRDVLTVEVETTDDMGQSESLAVPFEPAPAQAFILGSLFGWKNKLGHRRFRRAFVEVAKGNGKSPIAAGIGHYMLTATRKLRAEVYSAATDKDQAAITFRDAVEMWRRSPALFKRLLPSGMNPVWQLTLQATSSFFKPISSEKRGKSGIRPYCALVDEIHEHPDNAVIEMLRAGTKGNRQALVFEITNSGFDRNSVCWHEHEYSIRVASGEVENDAWFSYVCALDEDDDPFDDEACWVKANPLLGISIHHEFIREQVQEAKGMPSKESMVRRLHFCEWTDADDGWMTLAAWAPVESKDLRLEDFTGEVCYGGLDLSFTTDLSACVWTFPLGDDRYAQFADFWKPKEGLQEAVKRDQVPYDLWAKDGHLRLTEGKVIKLPPIAQRLAEVSDRFDLQGIAYDAYRFRELDDDMADLGIMLPMVEHPQGFRRQNENPLWMPTSVQEIENAIVEGRLVVAVNPVLRWNVLSAVARQDPAGTDNRILDKRRSRARIDGAVAAAMSLGLACRPAPSMESVYETRGMMEI